jgi:hypothetical protein
MNASQRFRTKRRYAHELFPEGEMDTLRPVAVEATYHYARAIGFDTYGTGWFEAGSEAHAGRVQQLVTERQVALLVDALAQGLTGEAGWEWAFWRAQDEAGEFIYERAVHYGIDPTAIKPYPCGAEPDHHDHRGPETVGGWPVLTQVEGKESECQECTEASDV